MEEWRDIPGEPGYSVSSRGRVRSNSRIIQRSNGRPQHIRERILKQSCDEWGYPMVGINRHTYKVHRLVAQSFLTPRGVDEEIRHLDGNPKNNSVYNLQYGTHSDNVLDGYTYRGYIQKSQKLSEKDAKEIKYRLVHGEKGRTLAKIFNVSEQTICDIKHNRIYRHVEV